MAKTKKVRFYRGKLPTVVWDARNNTALADLSKGHLTTDDEYTIEVMRKIGYIEIPLDATVPPVIPEEVQPAKTPDVKPIPPGLSEEGAAKLIAAKTKIAEDDDGPAVEAPSPKKEVKPKNTPSSKPKKTKTRSLKRRTQKKK